MLVCDSDLEIPSRLVVTTIQSECCLQAPSLAAEPVKGRVDVCFLLRHQNGERNVKISDV